MAAESPRAFNLSFANMSAYFLFFILSNPEFLISVSDMQYSPSTICGIQASAR